MKDANQLTLNEEIIPDYLGKPRIARSLKCGRGSQEKRVRAGDVTMERSEECKVIKSPTFSVFGGGGRGRP